MKPPGWISTPLTAALREPDGSGTTIVARTPLARWGVPEDLVGPALFLCPDHTRFVTGAVLPVDGGLPHRLRPLAAVLTGSGGDQRLERAAEWRPSHARQQRGGGP
jgi:hypothetical protein